MTTQLESDIAIPRILMQTWKTRQIPAAWRGSPESVHIFMPEWRYVLMTDEDNRQFVKQHFPDFLPYYDAFPYPIQRADAIRYMWLYVHGGVYMDLDILLLRPLDDLFRNKSADIFLVTSGNIGSYITNSFMASTPRQQLWLDVIEEMKQPLPAYALTKHFEVMMSTGPMMLDRVVRRGYYNFEVLPNRLIMPCSVCDTVCHTPPDAYARPLEGGSWNDWSSRFVNFFLCQWRLVIGVALVFLILWLVCRRRH